MTLTNAQQQAWDHFLISHALPSTTPLYECFMFGLKKPVVDELLDLVLKGQKRATASSILSFKDAKPPHVGDYSLVLNYEGEPKAIIQTQKTLMMPFNELTFEIVKAEGEDDTLESWQANHRRFFSEEGALLGYEFSETMPVLFEWFEVIEIL